MDEPVEKKGYRFEALSHDVIGVCIDVQRQLGLHCKEEDYQRALALGLKKRDIKFERESPIPVVYEGVVITERRVDFRIWNDQYELLLEAKARIGLEPKDVEQCLLYLSQGKFKISLLINFGEIPIGVRRLVYTPEEVTS